MAWLPDLHGGRPRPRASRVNLGLRVKPKPAEKSPRKSEPGKKR